MSEPRLRDAGASAVSAVSVVIPTYRRERVLLDTIDSLLSQQPAPAEILVVDQTEQHLPETQARLAELSEAGAIRFIRLPAPSITHAMNEGLLRATGDIVLFLDDDIRPGPNLIGAHAEAHRSDPGILVAGRVVQPWESGAAANSGSDRFSFSGTSPGPATEFMGGNFSIGRRRAIELGGMDENFVRVAYRFEAEFAHRFLARGGRIRFEPAASIDHLKADGGTRTFGDHLRTSRPDHSVGAYYFALRTMPPARAALEMVSRPLRSVATRHHLSRPWWIPVTFFSELRGIAWAIRLRASGPRYVRESEPS